MRLIDVDALLMDEADVCEDCGQTYGCVWGYSREKIENAPIVDATPVVHGVWITKEYMYGDPDVGIEDMWVDRIAEATDYYAECSVCGKNAGYDGEGSLILSDFCPSCGAKMDGGADNG